MLRTLHSYLGRELLKAFLMTSVALTLLVVMGGGVANIFRGEGIGAQAMLKIILFLTPVAVTLILPIAALFSATISYGRAAMDNEILAARAAGINVHRLLLSALLLGIFVTCTTYVTWNSLIPNLLGRIENMSRQDLPSIVMGQFQKGKPLTFSKYRMMANDCRELTPEMIPDRAEEGHVYVLLTGVTFLEVEDQEATRFGTAESTVIDFDRTGRTPEVTVDLRGVRSFDASRRQYWETNHQPLGPFQVPFPLKKRIKFENLTTLLEFRNNPLSIPDVQFLMQGMRREMATFVLYDECIKSIDQNLGGDGVFRIECDDRRYEVTANQYAVDPKDGQPSLAGVQVIEIPKDPNLHAQSFKANRATLELRSGLQRDRKNPIIVLNLQGSVESQRHPAGPNDRIIRKDRETLKPAQYLDQPELTRRMEDVDTERLLDARSTFGFYPRQEKLREKIIDKLAKYRSRVDGEIHFRASYSIGSVAVVLLGAILGIMVRGGQVLTAFGISCIPMVFIVIASIVGRNLSDRPDYALVSICVMWGSTIFLYVAMVVFATKFLKQ